MSQEVQIKAGIFVFEVAVVDNVMKTPMGFAIGMGYYGIKFIVGEENLIQVITFSINTIEEAKENMKKSIDYFKNGNATRDFNSNMERVDDPGTYGIDLSNFGF